MKNKKVKITNASTAQDASKQNAGKWIAKIFIDSCVCYTVAVFIISLIVSLFDSGMVIFVTDFVWLYAFALLIGIANLILRYKPFALWLRVVLHSLTIYSGFAVYIAIVKQNDASSVALLSIPFAVAYAIIMLIVLAVNSLIKKNIRENKSEYKSVYSNVNNR
jgi:mannose/fructose/N-acetylgalactosamine-specific phosphotransferase system component IIC